MKAFLALFLSAFCAGAAILIVNPLPISIPVAGGAASSGQPNSFSVQTNSSDGATILTASVVAGGANKLLLVGSCQGGTTVSTMLYGLQSMTLLARTNWFNGSAFMEVWYLINPTTGTATLTVTYSGNTDVGFIANCITNAHQSAPFGTIVMDHSATGRNGVTNSCTTTANQDLAVDVLGQEWNSSTAYNGTQVGTNNHSTTAFASAGMSWQTAVASSTTMIWSNNTTALKFSQIIVPVKRP